MENTRKRFFIIAILLICIFAAGAYIIKGYNILSQPDDVANAGFLADIASTFHIQTQQEPTSSAISGSPDVFSSLPSLPSSTYSTTPNINNSALFSSIQSTPTDIKGGSSTPELSPTLNGSPLGPASTPLQNLGSQSVVANWIAGTNSKISADTSLYTEGSQSLLLTTDGAGDIADAMVLNQGPYNLTDKYLEIWIRVSSTTNVEDLYFRASSDDLQSNYYTWKLNTQFNTSPDESEIQPGEWVPIVLTFDSNGEGMVTTGAPNPAALNSFDLHISDQKSGSLTVWLGGISAVAEPPQAALTIVLDNGWISEYTLALPTLAKYGFPAVIAEIPATANDSDFMSTQQLQDLQNNFGWDIACHTWDHDYQLGLSSTTIPIMDSEFTQCKNWLVQNGLGKASNILVWPDGSNSPAAIAEASKYFVTARGIVGTAFNTLPVANPMLLYSTEFGGSTPTSTLDADVDRCEANHEWCIFYGHIITTSTPIDQDEYASSSFNDFIAHIAQVGIPVKTITDVLSNEPNLPAPSEASLQSPLETSALVSPSLVAKPTIPFTENNFANDTNWQSTWGAKTISSSSFMDLQANVSTTGAAVLLNNTDNWTNYIFNATFDWIKGEEIGLIARHNNDNNYLVCEFEDTGENGVTIKLEQYINGKQETLETGGAVAYTGIGGNNDDVYVKTYGSYATCSFNGQTLPEYDMTIYPPPLKGGIGFTIWDPTLDNSEAVIKNVDVEPDYYY